MLEHRLACPEGSECTHALRFKGSHIKENKGCRGGRQEEFGGDEKGGRDNA